MYASEGLLVTDTVTACMQLTMQCRRQTENKEAPNSSNDCFK